MRRAWLMPLEAEARARDASAVSGEIVVMLGITCVQSRAMRHSSPTALQ
jgi:hypothetical protein